MGLLDDAIREHLELKRRRGASPEELERQEHEALGPARQGEFARSEPEPAEAPPPAEEPAAAEPSPVAPPPVPVEEPAPEAEPWLDEPDEVPAEDALDHDAAPEEEEEESPPPPAVPGGEDVLEETPEFLQETPEHDRLWFEQKPPRDFDFDK